MTEATDATDATEAIKMSVRLKKGSEKLVIYRGKKPQNV